MALTLGQVLELEVMRNSKILTKNHRLDTIVDGISIMEVPDISKWIEGNDIILTNLYSVYNDAKKMNEFVDSLYDGKVCALFIKTKRYVDTVPELILSVCDRLSIAVVDIPHDTRYMDIMFFVMAELFDSQVIRLSHYKETHNILTRLAMKNASSETIIDVFSTIIKNPVILYDRDFNCLHTTDNHFSKVTNADFAKDYQFDELYYYLQYSTFENNEKPFRHWVVPIKVFDMTKVYLTVIEKKHPMTEMDFIALENAMTVLTLEMVKQFAIDEVEKSFKQELIEDIISGRKISTLKNRVSSINLDINRKYSVIVSSLPNENDPLELNLANQFLSNTDTNKVMKLFLSMMKQYGFRGIAGIRRDLIIIFIEMSDKKSGKKGMAKMEELCTDVINEIKNNYNTTINIGYSTEFSYLDEIRQVYEKAKDAMEISKTLYGGNSVCNFEKLGIYKMLCSVYNKKDLEKFIPKPLLLLSENEKNGNSDLICTMRCFFNNNLNAKKTSDELFIHYKTLQYRLNKISSITGIDFKNSDEILELQMGLKILDILHLN